MFLTPKRGTRAWYYKFSRTLEKRKVFFRTYLCEINMALKVYIFINLNKNLYICFMLNQQFLNSQCSHQEIKEIFITVIHENYLGTTEKTCFSKKHSHPALSWFTAFYSCHKYGGAKHKSSKNSCIFVIRSNNVIKAVNNQSTWRMVSIFCRTCSCSWSINLKNKLLWSTYNREPPWQLHLCKQQSEWQSIKLTNVLH